MDFSEKVCFFYCRPAKKYWDQTVFLLNKCLKYIIICIRPSLLLFFLFIFLYNVYICLSDNCCLGCKKVRKKFVFSLAVSEKVCTFALAFGDDPGRDEKEIIEIVRTDNKDSAVSQFCFGIRRYRGRARE